MTTANKFTSQAPLTFAARPAGSEMKGRDSDYHGSISQLKRQECRINKLTIWDQFLDVTQERCLLGIAKTEEA
jgi:hypothetical protein